MPYRNISAEEFSALSPEAKEQHYRDYDEYCRQSWEDYDHAQAQRVAEHVELPYFMGHLDVICPIGAGTPSQAAEATHPRTHRISTEDAQRMLYEFCADDWEDGPRCLLQSLEAVKNDA